MKLFTKQQYRQLIKNGLLENRDRDNWPVIKLFLPGSNCTWLLTELNIEDGDSFFGLCDLGMGFPELGYVSLAELKSVRSRFNLPVERDLWFKATHPLSVYVRAAEMHDHIVENPDLLKLYIK